jgi:hypothetical protein
MRLEPLFASVLVELTQYVYIETDFTTQNNYA